eukprot:5053988-Prymnesium_polylepis.1
MRWVRRLWFARFKTLGIELVPDLASDLVSSSSSWLSNSSSNLSSRRRTSEPKYSGGKTSL